MLAPGMQVTFDEIREEVADYFYGSREVTRLERDELKRVDASILGGLRRFYTPMTTIPGCRHRWSFLRVIQEVVTTEGQHAYTMPEDFGGFKGPLIYDEGQSTVLGPCQLVAEARVREAYSGALVQSGLPVMYCQRPTGGLNTGTQLWEIDMWPCPNGEYTLTAPVNVNPPMLTSGRSVPYGGQEHSQTILLACKAEAEMRDVGPGPIYQQFVQALQGSVSLDKMAYAPDLIGYNGRGGPNRRRYLRIRGEMELGY